MIRLVVSVIGTSPDTGAEHCLATVESDRFDPDHLDEQVRLALAASRSASLASPVMQLSHWQPQVTVSLTVDEEVVRPSMHLSVETLFQLADARASFDFDPYV